MAMIALATFIFVKVFTKEYNRKTYEETRYYIKQKIKARQ